MADLIINANGVTGGTEFEVGYRLYGTGGAFTYVFPNPTTFPVVISGVPNGRYEVVIRKKCANGAWSVPSYGVSDACASPVSFTATRNGNNFDIVWTLAFGQAVFDIELTDPNGGIQVIRRTDGNSGSIIIPINPYMEGEWRLRIRGVCDEAAINLFSDWTNYIDINVVNTSSCPQVTNAQISNITSNGATITATPPVNTSNVLAYTLQLVPNGGSPINYTQGNPSWTITGLAANTTYDVYIITNCTNSGASTPLYVGQFATGSSSGITNGSASTGFNNVNGTMNFSTPQVVTLQIFNTLGTNGATANVNIAGLGTFTVSNSGTNPNQTTINVPAGVFNFVLSVTTPSGTSFGSLYI